MTTEETIKILPVFRINGSEYVELPNAWVEDCFEINLNVDERYSSVLIPIEELKRTHNVVG